MFTTTKSVVCYLLGIERFVLRHGNLEPLDNLVHRPAHRPSLQYAESHVNKHGTINKGTTKSVTYLDHDLRKRIRAVPYQHRQTCRPAEETQVT